ncbi:putative exodeoxyribonuclease I [Helianthus annuus]|nr:putative exodeoxyribonuclease I [Helianthus annuus]KAJ0486475.1 putative exodeoxyribonuclease I [Helianthus annuus]KAJ0657041.1 putative exodeoxyribonuclease I [Helianthus annuus]
MGVHGLWDLLSPVGRRVSVETLAGKRLAIDASIWMVQFMKAMRDEQGEMVKNAHILGFFRRICKLLFLRTKPVFVFDGATPALKRRTVIARRRQRENAQAKIRKTAEKLLLNHLKAMRLKELANDLENQRKSNSDKGKRVITDEEEDMNLPDTKVIDQEALDAMLAASIEAEEGGGFVGDASTSGAGDLAEEEEDGEDDDDEEMLLPTMEGKIDPAVLASLPPSMQLDLLVQMRERLMAENRQKYQKVKKAPARFSELQIESYLKTVAFRREINEVQKVAGGRGVGGVQTSRIASEANREFIFSSSFTGDRQSLASAGVDTNSNMQSQIATRQSSIGSVVGGSTVKSNGAKESTTNEPKKAFHEDVETYRDERGRVRVSKQPVINLSDCEWEEGARGETDGERPFATHSTGDESEVEWEEGPSDNNPDMGSARELEQKESVSKGDLLEEMDFQEAIRRSMDDVRYQNGIDASSLPEECKDDKNTDTENAVFVPQYLEDRADVDVDVDANKSPVGANKLSVNVDATTLNDPDLMEVQMEAAYQSDQIRDHDVVKAASDDRNSQGEKGAEMDLTEEDIVSLSNELHEYNCREKAEILISSNNISNSPDVNLSDAQQSEVKDVIVDHISESLEPKGTSFNESKAEFDTVQKVTEESDRNASHVQRQDEANKLVLNDMSNEEVEIAKANLEEEMTSLNKERSALGDEQRRLERNAESVSGEMFAECQELLQMFGLPYIIAPMEAEAQCAYMELEKLVDGVVTDDSDVLLFGARSVYKNIFDDRKYVETYFMKDIETELGLTREKLIRMAMLLGSDYTEGISGIGIVNAVEVINAFPEEDGLHKFREWIESPDPSILGKVDSKEGSNTRKRGSNASAEEASTVDDLKRIFMDKHRNVSKNWHIPSTFPSDAVVSAYASPQVDKSTEPFSWGKPDLFVLRKLCFEKFGWGTQKSDELLLPVLKEYNKHETQLRLEAFYTFNERFAKIRSKRISKAVKGMAGSKSSELMDYNEQLSPSNGNKKKKGKREDKNDGELQQHTEKSELSTHEGNGKKTKKGTSVKGTGKSVGRGRRKKKNNLELSETSSDDENQLQQVQAEHTHGARKSKRVKKTVISTYNEDSEKDEPTTQDHQETLVSSMEIGVSGDHDHKSPSSDADVADLGKVWCQDVEDDPEAELSKEYLKMGGGFCMEEDEDNKEPDMSGCSPPTEGLNELDQKGEVEASTIPDVATGTSVAVSPRNNEEDDDVGIRPVSFLSAMPNLRRKRKKAD